MLHAKQRANADIELAWRHCSIAHDIEPASENVAVLKRGLLNAMHIEIRRLWTEGSAALVDLCQRYYERDPHNSYVLQVLARSLMNARRFAEARRVWQRLALLDSGDAHLQLQIARCCNWLQLREDGLVAVREALAPTRTFGEPDDDRRQLEALPYTA